MTVFDDGFAKKSEGLHAAKVLGFYEHLRTYIYGKSLCIESLHDRVHRIALDSLEFDLPGKCFQPVHPHIMLR